MKIEQKNTVNFVMQCNIIFNHKESKNLEAARKF